MKNLLFLFASITLMFSACQNSNETNMDESLKAEADSLLKEVMNIHDVVMPKTLELENLKKKMKTGMDSLELDSTMTVNFNATIRDIDSAIYGMRNWMSNFEKPSDTTAIYKIVEYYNSEIEKMQKVKDLTLQTIPKAEALLSKKDSL